MKGVGEPLPDIDTTTAHTARVWNYWLGGKDNYLVDPVTEAGTEGWDEACRL